MRRQNHFDVRRKLSCQPSKDACKQRIGLRATLCLADGGKTLTNSFFEYVNLINKFVNIVKNLNQRTSMRRDRSALCSSLVSPEAAVDRPKLVLPASV